METRFWLTSSGRSPVEEFLAGVSKSVKADFFDAVSLLASGQVLTMPLSRNLSNIRPGLTALGSIDSFTS